MKFNLLKQLLFLGIMLSGSIIFAQTVTGTVTGDEGPLPGVNVIEKGTTNGVTTDFDGNYSIDLASSDAVLVFSFIGFTSQEQAVNGRSVINVQLAVDAQALDEVVVIGYGQTTVKDATGSVSAVKSEDFNKGVIASPEQLIQGKTAGVQISNSSGEPGAGIALRIRGTTSVRSNNNPLFVVDGVPLSGEASSAEGSDIGFGTSGAKNPLSFLNPNDIESISVLKDASSTAIYGSRGANGVVIITTKTGKGSQGGLFEYSAALSFAKAADTYDLLGKDQFLAGLNQFGLDATANDFGSNTDWQEVVLRSTVSHDQNISYSNNYGDGSIRATFGYAQQEGIIEKSSLERLTGRVNANHRFLDDKLKLTAQLSISQTKDESPPLSGSAGSKGDLLGSAYSANPTWPNDPTFNLEGNRNPINFLTYTQNESETDRQLLNFSAEYDFTTELTAKVNVGYDHSNSTREALASSLIDNAESGTSGNGAGFINDIEVSNKLLEFTLNYSKEFENSKLDALVGYSFQDFQREGRNVEGWGFTSENMNQMASDITAAANEAQARIDGSYQQYGYGPNLPNGFINRLFPNETNDLNYTNATVRSLVGNTFDFTDELQSFFGRVNYTIADKYLFTATVRADGSSKFGSDNQYGYFPSGAFAWKINEEDFTGDTFSTLKLRLSYGITGNQDGLGFGNFVRRERYADPSISDGGDVNPPGLTSVSFANDKLKWEETTSYGFGIDFGFANDRLKGTIDFYNKQTTDLLIKTVSAQPAPQPTVFENIDATVLNQGVEFSLDYDFIQSDDLTWNANFNIAYNENELQDFDGAISAGTIRGPGLSLAFSQILAGGHPLFSYFLRQFEGYDANGQGIFTGGVDNQTFVGKSALPEVTAGLSTSVSYKNWDVSLYFAGQFGHYVYNNTANAFFTAGNFGTARNVIPSVLTSGESTSAEASVSTRFLESADFIRLQNATIGYQVPLKEDGVIKSLRLTLTGQNLFIITDYTGLDPEVSTNPDNAGLLNDLPTAGIDYTSFPKPRTFTFGLNMTF